MNAQHHHTHSHGSHGHVHSHGHAHDDHDDHAHAHSHEAPSFKYSKEANTQKKANDHHHHHSHESASNKKPVVTQTKKETSFMDSERFLIARNACLSTLLISIAPFLILFFIPLNSNSGENQSLLKVLLAFASGSLLGDAFLHLIPHALDPHDHHGDDHDHHHHEHNHSHGHDHSAQTKVGLWVLTGIMAFLLVEKLVRNLNGEGHTHSHSSSQPAVKKTKKDKNSDDEDDKKKNKDEKKCEEKSGTCHTKIHQLHIFYSVKI